jgi:tryptophan halogenase
MIPEVRKVVVLGGGSAGFLAAIACKTIVPDLDVELYRSPEIGVIGVGEATIPTIPTLLHGDLKLDVAEFYRLAKPSWKLGIRFLWGPRKWFNYTFRSQCDTKYHALAHPTGFYCQDDFTAANVSSCIMDSGGCFLRRPDGFPTIDRDAAYHLENVTFVGFLEGHARRIGVSVHDDNVVHVRQNEHGVAGLTMASGVEVQADLYLDCSGFRSLLLGQALKEPFLSFNSSLYCDRAIIGGWDRGEERVLPFTVAETMNAGWCWQIDHEHRIHRGYVHSSAFMSEEEATREFLEKNPKIRAGETKVVKFRSGRYREMWVKNVVAIGNSSGFVEPLESTALGAISVECQAVAHTLRDTPIHCVTDSQMRQFNNRTARTWDAIRDFLSLHYRFNRRLDTPFWQACLADVDLAGAAHVVEFYRENGPAVTWRETLLDRFDQFKMDGYWTLLVGQQAPYHTSIVISDEEKAKWRRVQDFNRRVAANAMSAEEAFALIRRPEWQWRNDFYQRPPTIEVGGLF